MSESVVNSEISLQRAIGDLREDFRQHKYLKLRWTAGTKRSLDQNAIAHCWYEQVARELRQDTALGVKCYCKLHHGVPILRAEDADFRATYDAVIRPLHYGLKLEAMKSWPVTSLMTKAQLSAFLEAVQTDFAPTVRLEFPDSQMKQRA